METPYESRQAGKGAIAGSLAGFIGGLAMIPFFILSAMASNLPFMAIFAAIGSGFGVDTDSTIALGIVMHLAASVFVGIIFGIVTGLVRWLRIVSYGWGIGLGLITGIIAFGVFFIPGITPLLQAGMTAQQDLPISFAGHLVYGAVLGAVTARLVLDARKRRTEGVFECSTCHIRFTQAQDLDEHTRTAHHGVAA